MVLGKMLPPSLEYYTLHLPILALPSLLPPITSTPLPASCYFPTLPLLPLSPSNRLPLLPSPHPPHSFPPSSFPFSHPLCSLSPPFSHSLYPLSPQSLPFKILPPSLSRPSLLSSLPISLRNTVSYSLPLHFPPPRIVPHASPPPSLYLSHFLALSLTHPSHISLTLPPRHRTKYPPSQPLPTRPHLSPYPNLDLHPLYPSAHIPISPSLYSLPLPHTT